MKLVHEKLKLGIAGLGIAGGVTAPYLAAHPGIVITGAADRNPELRNRFGRDYRVSTYEDIDVMLRSAAVDAVYIATPHQFHRQHAIMAAERGKHIILEKPMALNLEDCDAIIEAAERNQVTLVVGHTHSFDSAILKMRSLASTGELGQLAMLSMWNFTDFLYRPRRSEELVTELGGGIIFNQLPHQIDMARFLAGAPVRSVRAHSVVLDRQRPTEGGCTAFLDFENGVAASLVYSGYDRFDSDEFYGWVGSTGRPKIPSHGTTRRALRENTVIETEAQLRSRRYGYGGDASFMVGEASYQPHFGALIATYELGDARPAPHGLTVYTDNGAREIQIPPNENGRSNLVEEFYQAVMNGVMPLHDGKFARGTVDVTLAILKSSQERREVFLS